MSEYPEPERVSTTTTTRTYNWYGYTITQDTLRRLTLLIQLAFGILNGLIALRFFLKLMAANPANPFAQLVYFITTPFVWLFQGITITPGFAGIELEFFDLIAIIVYTLVAWVIIRLLWILFARLR